MLLLVRWIVRVVPPRLRFVRRARPAACLDTARRGGRVGGPQARSRRRRDEKTRLTRRGARCTRPARIRIRGPTGTRATTRHGHARGKRIETETVASQAWCAQKCVCCYVLAHCCPMSPTCCRKQRARPRTQGHPAAAQERQHEPPRTAPGRPRAQNTVPPQRIHMSVPLVAQWAGTWAMLSSRAREQSSAAARMPQYLRASPTISRALQSSRLSCPGSPPCQCCSALWQLPARPSRRAPNS